MRPLLKMIEHKQDDIYIKNGERVSYKDTFEDCLVLMKKNENGKNVFVLGRNTRAFKIVTEMMCAYAGRVLH